MHKIQYLLPISVGAANSGARQVLGSLLCDYKQKANISTLNNYLNIFNENCCYLYIVIP